MYEIIKDQRIMLKPEQEAIKRLEDKLKESEEAIHKFESVTDFLKPFLHRKIIQDFYDLKSDYLSLKSYAATVVDLFKKK
jgi:hypothetical protein